MGIYKDNRAKGNQARTAIKKTTFHYVKRITFGGFLITGLLLFAQIVLLVEGSLWLNNYAGLIFEGSSIIGFIAILFLITGNSSPENKLTWSLIIAILPIAGIFLYIIINYDIGSKASRDSINKIISDTSKYLTTDEDIEVMLTTSHSDFSRLAGYMREKGACTVYSSTASNYYPLGDDVLEPLLEDLSKAEEFIFLEYFMIEEGHFWNSILNILKEKAANGVEVRLLYDDMGCLALLPRNYYKELKKCGIKVRIFSRLLPFLSFQYNNRDHRKIIVIDDKVAYSGGFNLCDEYINEYQPYGKWKDNGIRFEGNAVKQFSLLFLQMWNASNFGQDSASEKYDKYLKQYPAASDGYMIPYGDGPHRREALAKYVYKDIVNNATKYVWITSPYLILDHGMETSILHASKCGIDVRIVLPHIPDKKICFMIARSHYPTLLAAGVKIYEYEPGFIHAKTWLSDDHIGCVGSVNLDYRSLFLHYECGCLLYKSSILEDIHRDFDNTFEESIQVDMDYYNNLPALYRLFGRIFRIFGPLM